MNRTIEANFFPEVVEPIKEKACILIIDSNRDFIHAAKLALQIFWALPLGMKKVATKIAAQAIKQYGVAHRLALQMAARSPNSRTQRRNGPRVDVG